MIHHVDKALESFLRERVPLPEASVDLSFRAPEGGWTASVSRPTVDVFLWDIGRHEASKRAGIDQRLAADGRRERRPPPPVLCLRYLLTVWTREQRDEHELLGDVLACVLAHTRLPAELLPDALAGKACGLALGDDEHHFPNALWTAGAAKPGLHLEVTLPVEAIPWREQAVPAEEVRLQVEPKVPAPAGSAAAPAADGGAPAADGGAPEAPSGAEGPGAPARPPLRRSRVGGTLVMEGRAEPPGGPGTRERRPT